MVNRGDDGLNLSALSNSFDNIGKEVQQELFGADVNAIRKTMRDFKLLDNSRNICRMFSFYRDSNAV